MRAAEQAGLRVRKRLNHRAVVPVCVCAPRLRCGGLTRRAPPLEGGSDALSRERTALMAKLGGLAGGPRPYSFALGALTSPQQPSHDLIDAPPASHVLQPMTRPDRQLPRNRPRIVVRWRHLPQFLDFVRHSSTQIRVPQKAGRTSVRARRTSPTQTDGPTAPDIPKQLAQRDSPNSA